MYVSQNVRHFYKTKIYFPNPKLLNSLYAILFSLKKYVQFCFHLTYDWYELKFQGKKYLSISIHGLCYCTVQVYVINNFCNGVWSFWVEANIQVFYYHFLYVLPLEIQLSYVMVYFCSVSSVKMRGDCLFCWYWWNWWSGLLKFSFIISNIFFPLYLCQLALRVIWV